MISATLFAGALLAGGALFMAFIAWERHTHNQERRDLLNRVMARDFHDYQAAAREENKAPDPGRRHNIIANHLQRQLKGARQVGDE